MSKQRILVVDDDKAVVRLMRSYLEQAGYEVLMAYDGETAVHMLRREKPDLLLLDLMLPNRDGWDITRLVRGDATLAHIPIIMLTARVDDADKIVGLEMGADDYVKKPVEPRVLLARIRALLRRTGGADSKQPEPSDGYPDELNFGGLSISQQAHRVNLEGKTIELTTNEFELLWLLAANAGTILDRDTIYKVLRGINYDGLDRSVDVSISRLRKKLGDEPSAPERIKTIWGKGYLFVKDAW